MNKALIDAIRFKEAEIMQLFSEPFDDYDNWIAFLTEHFMDSRLGTLSVNCVLDKADQWHSARFQALYVACWIFYPLEKGSYMIELTPQQRTNAEASAGKLTWRKSSHLSATSHSARGGKDFSFIKGYGELLVIVEGNYLFLKMEGHQASSPSHLKSWVTKIRTGAGETSNTHLNSLATAQDKKYGIEQRGAENYSKAYKALLKGLGFSGKMVTFADVIKKLRQLFPRVLMPQSDIPALALNSYLDKIYVMINANSVVNKSVIYRLLMDAKKDIYSMVKILEAEDKRLPMGGLDYWGVNRIFQEIRMAPKDIDSALNEFVSAK